jgi:hypothetical protein
MSRGKRQERDGRGESRRSWIRVYGGGRSFRNLSVLLFGGNLVRDSVIRSAPKNLLVLQPSFTSL